MRSTDWLFNKEFVGCNNEGKLLIEFQSLKSLWNKLQQLKHLELRPIDDAPSDLGLEVFCDAEKVAEIYCLEVRGRSVPEEYSVFSAASNFSGIQLSLQECCDYFSSYSVND